MRRPNKVRLTAERIRQIPTPETGETTIWDTDVQGLGVRCLATGVKTFIVIYRAGYGRAGTPRRFTLGKVEGIRLEDARALALDIRAKVLKGGDPAEERKAAAREVKRPRLTLELALDRYDEDQERRKVVGRVGVLSALRRHLLSRLPNSLLIDLDRRAVVEAIEALEGDDKPGAAQALRSHASTFLKWCADRGLVPANPLQGYRAPRSTRAQRIAQPGRELSDAEVGWVWTAAGSPNVSDAFGRLLRILILTGQRRTETSRMKWSDLTEDRSLWRIPAQETKNGIAHEVPLPPLARQILNGAQRFKGCDYVFTTGGEVSISGWSKLEKRLRAQIDEDAAKRASTDGTPDKMGHWTLHDLRRTFRSGLSRMGVEPDVAEIMLNHRPETLRAIYDRDPRMAARIDAAERWANHVGAIVDPDGRSNVVQMKGVK